MIWNILNYPAGSMPVTTVQPDEQHFEDFHHDIIYRTCNESMKESAGLPVGIQVVSYPGQEEEILHLMQQLEPKINFRQKHKSRAFSQ